MGRRYATTTQRGLGAKHVADKKRLLALHRDGDPCWRCGQPMYKSQGLERDHVVDRALGGTEGPAVLAHARCNRSAGAKLRGQLYPETSRPGAPPATCKTCGKTYHRRAQACDICGAHYHPTYGAPGEQRTCSRSCGVELKRRTRGYAGYKPPSPKPQCQGCGRPCAAGKKYCSLTCARETSKDKNQTWPSSKIQHYTCRYCGKPGVVKAASQPREVCPARPCQLARLAANNLRVRKGLSKDEADAQVAAVVAAQAPSAYGRWQSSRAW